MNATEKTTPFVVNCQFQTVIIQFWKRKQKETRPILPICFILFLRTQRFTFVFVGFPSLLTIVDPSRMSRPSRLRRAKEAKKDKGSATASSTVAPTEVRRKKSRRQEIRSNIVKNSLSSKTNTRYQTSISSEFQLPEVTRSRSHRSNQFQSHQTSALDFDALPTAERKYSSRPMLRRKHLRGRKRKGVDGPGGSAASSKGLTVGQRNQLERETSAIQNLTNEERVEILFMSLLATVVTGQEVALGYWTKKLAFLQWAIVLFVSNRISNGSDAFFLKGSSGKHEQLFNGTVSFVWLMLAYLYTPGNFIVQTGFGVLAFLVSFILHARKGGFRGILRELGMRQVRFR